MENLSTSFGTENISIEKIILIDKNLKEFEWTLLWSKKDISDYYLILWYFILCLIVLLFFNNLLQGIQYLKKKIEGKKQYKYLQKIENQTEKQIKRIKGKDILIIKDIFNKSYNKIIQGEIDIQNMLSFFISWLYLQGIKDDYIKVLKKQEPWLFQFLLSFKKGNQLDNTIKESLQLFYRKIENGK